VVEPPAERLEVPVERDVVVGAGHVSS
jgi:hypothetical protein